MPAHRSGASAPAAGVRLGVLAQPWRAVVTADGAVHGPRGEPLRWVVVAEDRVHDPATSATRRQRCVEGTPVVETAVRAPGGDVVVTAFGVADRGGAIVLDVANRSGASVVLACSRSDVVAARPLAAPAAGGDVPASWRVLPLAHGSALRLAVPATTPLAGADLDALPHADAVVRGWRRQLAGGLHVELPDPGIDDLLRRARAQACLAPVPDPGDEPERFLLHVGQRVARGLADGVRAEDVAAAAARLATAHRRSVALPWAAAAALEAAVDALRAAGDARAVRDARAVVARAPEPEPAPAEPPGDEAHYEAWLTRRLAVARGSTVGVLPAFPRAWLGVDLSAYQVPTSLGPVGFAVRWHGERPALLWEAPLGAVVTCPGLDPSWSSTEPRGEALLAPPAA